MGKMLQGWSVNMAFRVVLQEILTLAANYKKSNFSKHKHKLLTILKISN